MFFVCKQKFYAWITDERLTFYMWKFPGFIFLLRGTFTQVFEFHDCTFKEKKIMGIHAQQKKVYMPYFEITAGIWRENEKEKRVLFQEPCSSPLSYNTLLNWSYFFVLFRKRAELISYLQSFSCGYKLLVWQ